ncbi:MAG: anhydro-N-acetylmuramic acid kinase AnmK [Sarcina sp.]
MYAVGLMSGTSLDGVDAILVEIHGCGIDTRVSQIAFDTFDIPKDLKQEIKDACDIEKSSTKLICSLNFKLGYLFAYAVKEICRSVNFDIQKLDYIASHGQTIYHIPNGDEKFIKSTLQIGEPAVIAYETRTKVISNFRTMDMAARGQGAPLVPYVENVLYKKLAKNGAIALQNIGGIGNITVINGDDIFAFDTGPGNMIINEVCEKLYDIPFDKDGKIASKGIVNERFLSYLINHEYIRRGIPKTTGREDFGEKFVSKLLDEFKDVKSCDLVATVTMFTAKSIEIAYKKFIFNVCKLEKIIISGGGAYNKTLVKMIKELMTGIEVLLQEDLGYSSDSKEALAFAILGNETLNKRPSNLINTTFAKRQVILGNITESPF